MAFGYTYPLPQLSGSLTPEQIHLLLANPRQVAKRVAQLANEKFIADWLLAQRFTATGSGVVLYDATGNRLYAADDPEVVAAGGEYPLTVMEQGELEAAKTSKRGHDTEIYDESIARRGISVVDEALGFLVNNVVRAVDEITLAVIASKVTRTIAASGAWTSGANIVRSVLRARVQADKALAGTAYSYDTVVLDELQYADVMAYLLEANYLPRETGNLLMASQLPQTWGGFTWVTSPWADQLGGDPLLVDRSRLGGMADEDLKSPGYVRVDPLGRNLAVGIETKINRLGSGTDSDRDGYRPRARRVTVPVITDPNAAVRITGTN